ncbi:hypothetical protein SD81_004200 [Tolypothrix campylonemoides VB511288]|nr:hypothetical protein SD81_004200 [Tolypothrix campylonemoides VB511288]
MKSIIRIAQRLMLVFLALIASSTMFLSSPAVAVTTDQETKEFFQSTDQNNNGIIEREELPSAGSRDEEYLKIFSNSRYSSYDEFLKKNDSDGDGKLNFEEFAKAWV